MADGLESDDVEMEDMDRAGSGRRGSTSFDGERRGGTLNPLTAGSTSLSGSPLMSPMGSLTGGDETSAARGGELFRWRLRPGQITRNIIRTWKTGMKRL
jgi:hypothetical protein